MTLRNDERVASEASTRDMHVGTVKFYKSENGWGAISSDALPPGRDAFVGFDVIDMPDYRCLETGQAVEFACVRIRQDSFDYIATHVLPL